MAEILDPEQESRRTLVRRARRYAASESYARDHADVPPADIEASTDDLDVAALLHAKLLVEKHGSIEAALEWVRIV